MTTKSTSRGAKTPSSNSNKALSKAVKRTYTPDPNNIHTDCAPCPECGSKTLGFNYFRNSTAMTVMCRKCHFNGPLITLDELGIDTKHVNVNTKKKLQVESMKLWNLQ